MVDASHRDVKATGYVDVHAHFTPPQTHDEQRHRFQLMQETHFYVSDLPTWSPETTLEYMNSIECQMQLLSNIPKQLDKLIASNTYGASVVQQYPDRFGLLAALPTDNCDAALNELHRCRNELKCDGYALTARYNGVYLADVSLQPLYDELNKLHATVHIHPDAYAEPLMSISNTDKKYATPLFDVAFETTRCIIDMLYNRIFQTYSDIKFIIGHCGACVPALSGRVMALGTEPWVHNPNQLTPTEMKHTLSQLYVDTAATGYDSHIAAALTMIDAHHIVYGSDCGVPCSNAHTMNDNIYALQHSKFLSQQQVQFIGTNALNLFPSAADRIKQHKQ